MVWQRQMLAEAEVEELPILKHSEPNGSVHYAKMRRVCLKETIGDGKNFMK